MKEKPGKPNCSSFRKKHGPRPAQSHKTIKWLARGHFLVGNIATSRSFRMSRKPNVDRRRERIEIINNNISQRR